jgi:Membrane-bound serine protease (ClpP class)
MLPGIAGAICLLVGAYAMQMLPVNYAGLALMALGLGLIVAEVVTPTVGAFGIGGVIAFVLGSVMLMDTGVPGYGVNLGVILGLATAAGGLLALVLTLLMRSRRRRVTVGGEEMIGAVAVVVESFDGGGWVQTHGETWRATGVAGLAAGTPVRVVRRHGLTLEVVAEPAGQSGARAPGE